MYHSPLPRPDTARLLDRLDGGVRRLPTRGQVLAVAMIANLAVLTMMLAATGLVIDLRAPDALPYWGSCALALALRLGLGGARHPRLRAVGHCAEYFVAFMLIGLLGAVGSYPVSAASRGFHDPALQAIDTFLHFDWTSWYVLVCAHPSLQVAGRVAYESIYLTPAVMLGWFAWTGRRREAHSMLATFWIAAAITLAMFYFLPAVGPFSYLWHGPIPYMPASRLWQPELIPALRHHAVHVIDLGELRGLVSAPSFHTAAAVLYIALAWPYRRLRWPVLAVNGAMLLSTPVEGTHYLADMLAGAAVALTSLGLMAWLERLAARAALVPGPAAAAVLDAGLTTSRLT